MLKEALEYLVNQAVLTRDAKPLTVEQEPKGYYFIRRPDGSLDRCVADPPHRQHTALDLTAIAEFAADNPETAEVWYSRQAVVCVLDKGARRETVTLTLEFSPQLRELQALEKNPRSLSQRDIVFLLRTTFRRCLGRTGNFLEVLRSVRFNSQATGEGTVQHGKSSVGKTLAQQITGADAIPEYVVLEVPIFTHASLAMMFSVELAVEPDPATATFKLIPLPNEIERAISDGETMIAEKLGALMTEDVAVHYGRN